MNTLSSFTVYTAALHALILILILAWAILDWLYFSKQNIFLIKNKQQETLHQQQAAGEAQTQC